MRDKKGLFLTSATLKKLPIFVKVAQGVANMLMSLV